MIHEIDVVKGDITDLEVDAIVNAANKSLLGGGGVDGAIHRKAGKELYNECREIRQHDYPMGLPTGEACVTKGYRLKAPFVIHTVGPVYSEKEDRSALLRDCFLNSLELAEQLKLETIAFPAISTGAYNWPLESCAEIAKDVLTKFHSKTIMKAVVCLYDDKSYAVFRRTFRK
jgi:O-acetyl-ADP-ribose deacetylase (regulator of RNase III)